MIELGKKLLISGWTNLREAVKVKKNCSRVKVNFFKIWAFSFRFYLDVSTELKKDKWPKIPSQYAAHLLRSSTHSFTLLG